MAWHGMAWHGAASVRARLLNVAKAQGVDFNQVLARADGKAWNKDSWKWPIKTTAAIAQLPDGTTAYTLHHSIISDLVRDGLLWSGPAQALAHRFNDAFQAGIF